jgi:hypothetical protein
MKDFLNDLTGGFVEDDYADNRPEVRPLGLVVSAKAGSSRALNDEVEAYLFLTDGGRTPFVIFEEEDEEDPMEGPPKFANAKEFREAMGTLHLPTEAEATKWSREVIAERLAQWEAPQPSQAQVPGAQHRGD